MLCLVLFAFYGLASLLLSVAVAMASRAFVRRKPQTSGALLALRLLPAAGAALLVATIVLPAFLADEPRHEIETAGPVLIGFAAIALLMIGDALRRGARAWASAAALLRGFDVTERRSARDGRRVDIVDSIEPIVAVIGGWRPRIVAATRVVAACSREEFVQVIAHEAAHVAARDNLKLLIQVASPDALAWLPAGATLERCWRSAAEFEADERAAGTDRRKRLDLAAALVKVARLAGGANRAARGLAMSVAVDDVEGRVRRLLAPATIGARPFSTRVLAVVALCVPLAAVPLYPAVQRLVELLVALGR